MTPPIDFKGVKAVALHKARALLEEWLPGGRFEGNEYVALNPTRNDRNFGSFKINWQTGKWADFADAAEGGDMISLFAYINGLDQGEAARGLAERLGVPPHRTNGAAPQTDPTTYAWGEEGPPTGHEEVRRHYYPKCGAPKLKIKIKKRDGSWLNCYRVLNDDKPIGWQYKKPADFRPILYFGSAHNPNQAFWTEGEKDTDTLDAIGVMSFTFGGVGDGLPDGVEEHLKRIGDRRLVIPADNDESGRAHAQKKAKLAHAAGVKRICIFDPAAVWPECPKGGDVSDWIEKGGGTRERLLKIIDALPDWQPTTDQTASEPESDNEEAWSWDHPDLSLLDDRRGELPAFPLDVFSSSWQEWATNAAHGAGTIVDHVMVPLLGTASSLVGIARRIRPTKSWAEPLTQWIAIVGYSGTGKTPGLDVTKRALARIEGNRKNRNGELRRAHESKIENAKAANKKWKGEVKDAVENGKKPPPMPPAAEIPEPFVMPRLYVSNSTIEKLAVLLQARPQGLLLIADELAGLFLNLSRYSGGTDREFWLEAWNGKPYIVERKGSQPVDVDHLLVGLVGGFQPDKLVRSLEGDADGLYARVLFSWPTEAPYQALTDTVEEIEPEFENALTKLIDLAEFEEGKLIMRYATLASDAREVFEKFRRLTHQKRNGLDGREREWWAKTPAHVLRLAGTLAYLDWAMQSVGTPTSAPTTIEVSFVAGAVRLMTEYFWPHARAALRQIGLTEGDAKARRVLRWLRAERGPEDDVSVEDIRVHALGRAVDAEKAQELIDTLGKARWLRKAPTASTVVGRRPHRWQINPRLWALPEIPEIPESPTGNVDNAEPQPEVRLSGIPGISGKQEENSTEGPSRANGRHRRSL